MRVLEMRGGPEDKVWLLTVMMFPAPGQAYARQAYFAIEVAKGLMESSGDEVYLSKEHLNTLIDAPSYAEMRTQRLEATRHGYVAGDFLAMIYAMYCFPKIFEEPSVRKAVELMQALARQSLFGDEKPMPRSPTTIRKHFESHRDVAHLWAALRLHEAFPIRPQAETLATPEGRRDLLAIAGSIQDFGCSFIPKRAKPALPLLDASTIWRVPTDRRLTPPWKEPPSFLVKGLKTYRAT